ncbi:Gifsy-1 prophage DinI [Salmonella enterica subsp. diarizonae]|nr:Gifsy-1 prophage DinI [Salmonella enterica subsp. diarizonae]
MRIELVISRTKQLAEGAVPVLEKELMTCLQNLTIRRGSQDGLSIVGAADGDKNVYRAFCRKRGKALTTGFINIALNTGVHFSEYRNLRIPLMLPTIFNRVRVSLRRGDRPTRTRSYRGRKR